MIYPINKYLVVEPIDEVKKDSGVLVPQDVQIDNSPYKLLNIIEPHVDSRLRKGMRIVAPSHMVEKVSFFGEEHYLILENHVMAFYEV